MFLFHGLGDIVDGEGERTLAEFRGIERLQVVVVECRMLLRQTEGLMDLPVFVDITEIGLSVKTIVTL
jgi:hypothetical protein